MLEALQRISNLQENEAPVLNPPPSLTKSKRRLLRLQTIRRQVPSPEVTNDTLPASTDSNTPVAASAKHAAFSAGICTAAYDWSDDEDSELEVTVSTQYSLLWWFGVVLAILLPDAVARLVKIGATLDDMTMLRQEVSRFPETHPLNIPPHTMPPEDFAELDRNLIAFHADLLQLWRRVVKLKVLDPVTESSLEFAMSAGSSFEPRRDYMISFYLLLSIAVYFTSNIHLSLVLLHFNIYDLLVCLRTKALDDSFQSILQPLSSAIEEYLLLPMSREHQQEQMFLLNKMLAVREHWEDQALGISFSVPLANTVLSINIGLLMSIVAATSVRCINVVVYGFYPSLGRINLTRFLMTRMLPTRDGAPVQDDTNVKHETTKPPRGSSASFAMPQPRVASAEMRESQGSPKDADRPSAACRHALAPVQCGKEAGEGLRRRDRGMGLSREGCQGKE